MAVPSFCIKFAIIIEQKITKYINNYLIMFYHNCDRLLCSISCCVSCDVRDQIKDLLTYVYPHKDLLTSTEQVSLIGLLPWRFVFS
jgi:hypothetical protein